MRKELPQAVRSPAEPVLTPRIDNIHWWERLGTFNPGVTEYKGNVILLYRAYDDFRMSRLGLAHSQDGVNFTRYDHPAIDTNPDDPYERIGIEDPRVTQIDDTYYILTTAASYNRIGELPEVGGEKYGVPWRVRVGMHTTKDFKSYKHWGVIRPDVPAKNACLLPEKIKDHYGLYYREHTMAGDNILKLVYTKDFVQWSDPYVIKWPMESEWPGGKCGVSSQPMVTDAGFLTVYHTVDRTGVYRLGLMLFDRQDPTQILWYSNPILEPELHYEQEGYVSNVVYSCGAIIRGNELWIYYGAADRVVGRAVLSLEGVL